MTWLDQFLLGAIGMGFAVAGLFFIRYWRETKDRFFGWFAAGFLILALNRVVLALTLEPSETTLVPYLVRLFAFLVFILAIVDKNLRRREVTP